MSVTDDDVGLDTFDQYVDAQTQLREFVGDQARRRLARAALERSQRDLEEYAEDTAALISNGQTSAASAAAEFLGKQLTFGAKPDIDGALSDSLMTPDHPGADYGLRRLWYLIDEGRSEGDAREIAGNDAAQLAIGDLQAAARTGFDEGAHVADRELRYRKVANPDACDWCRGVADEGARFRDADSVPFHNGCRCDVAPDVDRVHYAELRFEHDTGEMYSFADPQDWESDEGILLHGFDENAATAVSDALADSFDGIDPYYVNQLAGVSSSMDASEAAVAWYDEDAKTISIKPSLFSDFQAELYEMDKTPVGTEWGADTNWWSPDDLVSSSERLITHEIGHHLDLSLDELGPSAGAPSGVTSAFEELRWRLREAGVKPDGDVRIGQYAASSTEETVAELWAEYKTSPQPRAPAKLVGEFFLDALSQAPVDELAGVAG